MTREIDKLAWGTDAGFYRLLPKEVLMPTDEVGVRSILARAKEERRPITFRAAGTSLSGQAITDSLLVVCGKKWERFEVLDGGARIRLQPGIVGERVNEILRPYGRRFTPDPASVKSAMVGGIVMNNASGMSCGTHANSYRMLDSVRIVLADGTALDTADPNSRAAFAASHPDFMTRLLALRDRVRADAALAERIRRKYAIKNVTGLTILPFAEYDDPFDIIAHLIPGSEGTLAFLSEIVFRTGKIAPLSESALVLFPSAHIACEAVAALKPTGAADARCARWKRISPSSPAFRRRRARCSSRSRRKTRTSYPAAARRSSPRSPPSRRSRPFRSRPTPPSSRAGGRCAAASSRQWAARARSAPPA